tara:strand:+ start:5159 stop:5644 length:486 start_codon:yes stop_codon:yes gene_type:complete
MSIPQEMIIQADAIGSGMNEASNQGMQMITPSGNFSSRALNAVIDAVNKIMPMFGEMEQMAQYNEDMTMMPMEMLNAVMAIMTVAQQAGVPVEIEISSIESDNDLAKLAALLKRLANDGKLKEFLEKASTPVQAEEVTMNTEMPGETQDTITDEELFAQRV